MVGVAYQEKADNGIQQITKTAGQINPDFFAV